MAVFPLEAKENWQAARTALFVEFMPDATYQGDFAKEPVDLNQVNRMMNTWKATPGTLSLIGKHLGLAL